MVAKSTLQTEISIPSGLSQEVKAEIGNRFVKAIVSRTKSGVDSKGKRFVKYNPDYVAEKGSSKVDLTDSGDTLDELEVIEIGSNYITVGYPTSFPTADQVEGLVLGASGKAGVVGNSKKARPYIGLPKSVSDLIIAQTISEFDTGEGQLAVAKDKAVTGFIDRVLGVEPSKPKSNKVSLFINKLLKKQGVD